MTEHTPSVIKRLWREYLHSYWPLVALAVVFMVIGGSTLGVLSYLLEPMFDRVFVGGQEDMILVVGLAIFGLFILRAFCGVAQRAILAHVSFKSSAVIQHDLLEHALRLDNSYHAENPPGQMIERVQGDVLAVQTTWNALLIGAGRDVVSLVSLMVVAILVDPIWTLVAIVGLPILMAPSFGAQRYIRKKSFALRDIAGRRTTRLDEIFHGITPIKLNRMETYQTGRFAQVTDEHVNASIKMNTGYAVSPALVDVAVGLGFLAVLMYGGREIITGEKTVGQFMSFFTALTLAFQPLRRLASLAGAYQTMMASLHRIFTMLDTRPLIEDAGTEEPTLHDTTIQFENVSLAYGEAGVLHNLSFTAKAGETTALVGLSGSGKTTIFNALTRLADPQSGRILIGGHDISDMPLSTLRDTFSVVSQETLLFDETLRDNILVGNAHVTEAEMKVAMDAAHVTDFVDDLKDGLETQVGPRGSNLSGGQRQRVAIARALLREAPVLLLDEATSALDAKSETLVQNALDQLSKARTTLVIAHRLSTIRDADKILVLRDGQLAEEGTHEDLMARGGLYKQLHALQFEAKS